MTLNRRGYTLLELIIACSMVMIVLYGLYTTLSSMVNFEVEAVRKSSVNSWSNVSLSVMTKEIEDANVLYFPDAANPSTNGILGCTNWSTKMNGPATGAALDAALPVKLFYYCLDTTTGPTQPITGAQINVLRRMSLTVASCPLYGAVTPTTYACTSGNPLGAGSTNDVIATQVNYVNGLTSIFSDNNGTYASVVNVNFQLGDPNPAGATAPSGSASNARIVNPQTSTVNTTVQLERSYMNTND
jgi:type II secretory pathway pseudopilin PulG